MVWNVCCRELLMWSNATGPQALLHPLPLLPSISLAMPAAAISTIYKKSLFTFWVLTATTADDIFCVFLGVFPPKRGIEAKRRFSHAEIMWFSERALNSQETLMSCFIDRPGHKNYLLHGEKRISQAFSISKLRCPLLNGCEERQFLGIHLILQWHHEM